MFFILLIQMEGDLIGRMCLKIFTNTMKSIKLIYMVQFGFSNFSLFLSYNFHLEFVFFKNKIRKTF